MGAIKGTRKKKKKANIVRKYSYLGRWIQSHSFIPLTLAQAVGRYLGKSGVSVSVEEEERRLPYPKSLSLLGRIRRNRMMIAKEIMNGDQHQIAA